jgi:hypothetical protein
VSESSPATPRALWGRGVALAATGLAAGFLAGATFPGERSSVGMPEMAFSSPRVRAPIAPGKGDRLRRQLRPRRVKAWMKACEKACGKRGHPPIGV